MWRRWAIVLAWGAAYRRECVQTVGPCTDQWTAPNAPCATVSIPDAPGDRDHQNRALSRGSELWVLIKDNHSKSFHFEHTIYSGRELKDRLLQAGFGQVNLFGDLEGKPYGLEATRLVAVGHNT